MLPKNGKGLTPAFGSQLIHKRTETLAAYTMTLKK